MIPSLYWPGVLIAAVAVGLEGFPEVPTDDMTNDDDFIQALHHLLLDIHVLEGTLICPETGHRFPIHEGIPCMMYDPPSPSLHPHFHQSS